MIGPEEAVIGSILAEPALWPEVASLVTVDDFTSEVNKSVFEKMIDLREDGIPLDLITVSSCLNCDLGDVSAKEYLFNITKEIPSALHVDHYVQILRQKSNERIIREACSILAQDPRNEQAQEKLRAALNTRESIKRRPLSLLDCSNNYMEVLDNRALGKTDSIPTGLTRLDSIVSFSKQALITIGARTSKGKSALLIKLSYLFSKRGIKVLFVSAEMTQTELMDRLVALKTNIPLWQIRKQAVKNRMSEVTEAVSENSRLPFFIEEGGRFTLPRIVATVQKFQPEVVVIDYIQRFSPPSKSETRASFFSDIANGLKSLAMDQDLLILTASQLNRDLEHRNNSTPNLADLKESGGIEEASDVVILIDSPEMGRDGIRNVDLLISKNRNGSCASIPFKFFENTTNFEELKT